MGLKCQYILTMSEDMEENMKEIFTVKKLIQTRSIFDGIEMQTADHAYN